MPPRAVVCSLCGGKFFKSSLAHHQKVCREKVGKQCQECAYCHQLWPMLEMDDHVRTCPAARAAGARPTGASAALAKRLCDYQHRLENGIPEIQEERGLGGNGMGDVAEYAAEDDCRIACQFCGRKFAMDRIGTHQAICQRLSSKRRPRPKEITPNTAPMPEPTQSNWRQKSAAFREAAQAGREYPMPTWGSGDSASNGSFNRTGNRSTGSFNRSAKRPAAGSALAAIRQKASPEKSLKVPSPQMTRSGAMRRASAPEPALESIDERSPPSSSSRQNRKARSNSTGGMRQDDIPPLPQWGSGAPSRYGRNCMTSPPVRTTPHNTSWGGCTRVGAVEKEGFESTRCSMGNPLDRSFLYESYDNRMKNFAPHKMNSTVPQPPPRSVSAAPVLLGRGRGSESRHVHFA